MSLATKYPIQNIYLNNSRDSPLPYVRFEFKGVLREYVVLAKEKREGEFLLKLAKVSQIWCIQRGELLLLELKPLFGESRVYEIQPRNVDLMQVC